MRDFKESRNREFNRIYVGENQEKGMSKGEVEQSGEKQVGGREWVDRGQNSTVDGEGKEMVED